MAEERWLVVGLGNPGPAYASNRHNVGFMVADVLAERMGSRFRAGRHAASVADGLLAGLRVTVAKPMSFMNASGGPVAGLCRYYRVSMDHLVVVHDELDIPFGTLRLKLGGGDNGHNGLRSVSRSVASREYLRLRVGIGRPPRRIDPADFVLSDFSAAERKELPFLLPHAADAVETLLVQGLAAAQNAFHTSTSGQGNHSGA